MKMLLGIGQSASITSSRPLKVLKFILFLFIELVHWLVLQMILLWQFLSHLKVGICVYVPIAYTIFTFKLTSDFVEVTEVADQNEPRNAQGLP